MSLFIETYQYCWGEQLAPDCFGYYLGCWEQSAEEGPFPSRAARTAYEDAVHAYATEQGITGDSYTLAACMTIIRDGDEQDRAFARDVLERQDIDIDAEQEEALEEIVDRFRDYEEHPS